MGNPDLPCTPLAWPGPGQGQPHLAGGDTAGPGTDHLVGDLAAPELLAFGIGQEGQGRLLQLVRDLVGCRIAGGSWAGMSARAGLTRLGTAQKPPVQAPRDPTWILFAFGGF